MALNTLFLFLALVALLGLNAFFVLAEFAIVKVRTSRVLELVADGHPRARLLRDIQTKLDDYLGVCQVGITLASVALGMVGNWATDVLMGRSSRELWHYLLAVGFSYVIVSGSHIVLGELVPKSIAIRVADRAALFCAPPLRFFHALFWPALWLFNQVAQVFLRLLGMHRSAAEPQHSEDELRIILERSQERGMMSFRRLLFMENVFDFGELMVRDAMRARSVVRCIQAELPWEANLEVVRASRFTRYPLLTATSQRPTGFVHLKDLVIKGTGQTPDLLSIVRPILVTTEMTSLESLLVEMQRRRVHAAIVTGDQNAWTGFITLEDIVEELVGTIRDEFEDEAPIRLADALTLDRIILELDAGSIIDAVRQAVNQIPKEALPIPPAKLIATLTSRERLIGTYLGHGFALPHARLSGIGQPVLLVLRSSRGITCEGTQELAHLLFVLLTPTGLPRVHLRLQSTIATLLHESEYVKERLMTAETREEILEAVRTGEQAALD